MTLSGGQRRNLAELVIAPLGDGLAAQSNHRGEGAGPDTPPNDQPTEPVSEEKHPVSALDLGHLLKKNDRVKYAHITTPRTAISRAIAASSGNAFGGVNGLTQIRILTP